MTSPGRRPAITAATVLLACACSASEDAGESPPVGGVAADPVAVVIDGRFDDWVGAEEIGVGGFDEIRSVAIRRDAHAVYLRLTLRDTMNVQGRESPLLLVFDADDDPTSGVTAFGLPGADLVVSLSWLDGDGMPSDGVAAWVPTRASPDRTAATGAVSRPADIGLWFEPRHSAAMIELRLARGAGRFEGGSFSARAVSVDPTGRVRARSPVIDADAGLDSGLPDRAPVWPRVDADDLRRTSGADVRVVVWNVAGRLVRDPGPARRILAALDPDVVLLDEVSPDLTVEDVRGVLPRPDAGSWSIHIGSSGGRQRGVIAARGDVRPAAAFDTVSYADVEGDDARGLLPPGQARAGVPAAGALVEAGGSRFLAVAIDLVCCGNSTDSPQERLRLLEARAINRAARAEIARSGPLPVLIGGDFNLVGAEGPLLAAGAGLADGGGDLTPVYALQLDGASSSTWVGPGTPFPPGQLDYLLYPPGILRPLNAFVFETDDLRPDALDALGLAADDSDRASDHRPLVVDFEVSSTDRR